MKKYKHLRVRIKEDLHFYLKQRAFHDEKSLRSLIEEALEDKFNFVRKEGEKK